MTTRTRIARIAATIAVLLAAPAYAQQPQGITKDPLKQPAGSFVLKMGNEQGALQGFAATWTGGKVATDQWDAPDAKMPAKAEGAMFEFIASTGAPRMFYNWVSAAFSGKNVPQAGEVIRKSVMGVAHTEQFAAAVVGEVDFPAFAAGKQKGEAEFVVRAKGQWLTGAGAKAPAPLAKMPPPAVSPAVSGYRLSFGSGQAVSIDGVEAFTLKPLQPAKITLHTRSPATEALQKLAQSKTKQPLGVAKDPAREARLELLGADGRTVLAAVTLPDVQVEAGSPEKPGMAGAAIGKVAPGVVTLVAARAELAFFPSSLKMQ